jgi:hypothetical protein
MKTPVFCIVSQDGTCYQSNNLLDICKFYDKNIDNNIDVSVFDSNWNVIILKKKSNETKLYNKTYKYRCDPVPNTGKRNYYYGYRKPQTANEKRQYFKVDYTQSKLIRVKRSYKHLVSTYDDIFRSNIKNKSWKNNKKKKKQYK